MYKKIKLKGIQFTAHSNISLLSNEILVRQKCGFNEVNISLQIVTSQETFSLNVHMGQFANNCMAAYR